MSETVSIDGPPVAKPSRRRSAKPATATASALALHLDCSRAYIGKLEAEGVIQRQGQGFPLDGMRPRKNFYRLVAPTDLSEFRTSRRFRYLGNPRKLSVLKKGDVVFGAEGFGKGRTLIVIDELSKTITNIHGVIFSRKFHPQLVHWMLSWLLEKDRSCRRTSSRWLRGQFGYQLLGQSSYSTLPRPRHGNNL